MDNKRNITYSPVLLTSAACEMSFLLPVKECFDISDSLYDFLNTKCPLFMKVSMLQEK